MAETMSKFHLPFHRRYERYCTLAATGQLGGPEMFELNEHIASCSSCREFLESISQVSVQAMPLWPQIEPRKEMQNLRKECANVSFRALQPRAPHSLTSNQSPYQKASSYNTMAIHNVSVITVTPPPSRLLHPPESVSLATGRGHRCMRCNRHRRLLSRKRTLSANAKQTPQISPTTVLPPPTSTTPEDSTRLADLEQQKATLERQLADLTRRLTVSTTEQDSLKQELAAARDKLTSIDRPTVSAPQVTVAETQGATNQVAILQSEVHRLNQRLAETEINVGIQKQTTEELTAKLETAEADLRRERDLKSAKSELGDVVAARNLHIVDVYDADTSGRQQRAYGRVFYVEGKSLLFYAYDLNDPHQFKKNVVFYVWGGKAGVKEVTHSLGILHKDDDGQSRWAMTFDDPKVLSEINSVFVTAESASKHLDAPHGKKVLYAYFGGTPNHP